MNSNTLQADDGLRRLGYLLSEAATNLEHGVPVSTGSDGGFDRILTVALQSMPRSIGTSGVVLARLFLLPAHLAVGVYKAAATVPGILAAVDKGHGLVRDELGNGRARINAEGYTEYLYQNALTGDYFFYAPDAPSGRQVALIEGSASLAMLMAGGGGSIVPVTGPGFVVGSGAVRTSVQVARTKALLRTYPDMIDPRTGLRVLLPSGLRGAVPAAQQVTWGATQRGEFIAEWYRRGYSTPAGGWSIY